MNFRRKKDILFIIIKLIIEDIILSHILSGRHLFRASGNIRFSSIPIFIMIFVIIFIGQFKQLDFDFRPQREEPDLLPDSPNRRPTDILLSTSWCRSPSLALDYANISPFTISPSRMVAQSLLRPIRLRNDNMRSHSLGTQSIVFENSGGYDKETTAFLNGLCRDQDRILHCKAAISRKSHPGSDFYCYALWRSGGYPNIFGSLHNLNRWTDLLLKYI